MWIGEPAFRSWEEWVDRDERDLSREGVLEDSPEGPRVRDLMLTELVRPWIGRRFRLERHMSNGRMILTLVEVD